MQPQRFSQIEADYNHVCALRVDGTVLCWGTDNGGEVTDVPGKAVDVGEAGDNGISALARWSVGATTRWATRPPLNLALQRWRWATARPVPSARLVDSSAGTDDLETEPTGNFSALQLSSYSNASTAPLMPAACWSVGGLRVGWGLLRLGVMAEQPVQLFMPSNTQTFWLLSPFAPHRFALAFLSCRLKMRF